MAGPTSSPGEYRPDIDGLRAIAVLAVVVYHYVPAWLPGGFVGVDVFFVLSGFLITQVNLRRLDRGSFSFLDFYARRVRRLMPAMVLVVGATLGVGSVLYSPAEQSALGHAAAAASLYAANVHFFITSDYFAAPVETRPLLHLWSLAVEEQFYLVAPVALWALARRRRLLWWSTVGMVLASFVACLWMSHAVPGAAFYLTPFRAWELGLGALLALRPLRDVAPRTRVGLGGLGLVAVLGSCIGLDHHMRFPGMIAAIPTLGTLAVLACGPDHPVGTILSTRPLRAIGRWSYAWYLWHWPALAFATFVWMRPPELAEAAMLALGTLVLSAVATRFFETPLRHWRPDLPGRAVLYGTLATVGLAIMGVSLHAPELDTEPAVQETPLSEALSTRPADCSALPLPLRSVHSCYIGATEGSPNLLVWGDSHVAVLGQLMDALAPTHHFRGPLLSYHDCPPIFGVDRAELPVRHRCAEHNETVLTWLHRNRPATVVMHARWPLVFEGTRYGDPSLPDARFIQAGSRDRSADLAASLERTVRAVQALGAHVVLLGPVPETRFHVQSVWERAARLGLPMPAGPTQAEVAERTRSSRAVLSSVARQTGATLLHPTDILCATDPCAVVQNGESLYLDTNHLDPQAARMLSPLFAEVEARPGD